MAELDAYFEAMIETGGSDLHLSGPAPPVGSHRRRRDPPRIASFAERRYPSYGPRNHAGSQPAGIRRAERHGFCVRDPRLHPPPLQRSRRFTGCRGRLPRHPGRGDHAEQLNLPRGITDLCHLSRGLVVVTGPTGSGKSTTLAALVDLVNKTRNDQLFSCAARGLAPGPEPRACRGNAGPGNDRNRDGNGGNRPSCLRRFGQMRDWRFADLVRASTLEGPPLANLTERLA